VATTGDAFPADTTAATVLDFINTHDHQGRLPDRLSTAAGLEEWLGSLVPPVIDETLGAVDAVEAREIRDALITVLLGHGDADSITDDEIAEARRALNRAALRFPLQARFTDNGVALVSAQPALAGVLGTVLAEVAELSQSGGWVKVKACRNCHHGFIDSSRNLSATFCSTQCKSQAGMRAYRSRQRDSDEA
jgi:predicted RNA-binding Zn ribbon-like protein